MIVTITEYAKLAHDQSGNVLPLGTQRLACQQLAAAGSSAALNLGTRFVRLATDTGILVYRDGACEGFYPPGCIEFISVDGGEVIAITTA